MSVNPNVLNVEACGAFLRVVFVCGHVVTVVDETPTPADCPQCQVEADMKEHRGNADDAGAATLILRTTDHPGARSRLLQPTDRRAFFVRVPLDDGRTLQLEFGAKGREIFERLILSHMLDGETGQFDALEDGPRKPTKGR